MGDCFRAPFSQGRIDWAQTVTPAVRAFVKAAAAAADGSLWGIVTRGQVCEL